MEASGVEQEPDSVQAKASWRRLSASDIKSLALIADKVHPVLPEDHEVFTERVQLFPEGCLGLFDHQSEELWGYAISHPIRRRQPPALNSPLRHIATEADQYYIHDMAILPEVRARGFANECMSKLSAIAKRYPTTCLISVYGTARFWGLFGFVQVEIDNDLQKKLLDYRDDAVYLERKNDEYQP